MRPVRGVIVGVARRGVPGYIYTIALQQSVSLYRTIAGVTPYLVLTGI